MIIKKKIIFTYPKKIIINISIEEMSSFKLKFYAVNFEFSLINDLKQTFKNGKAIGCFYHYTRALLKNVKK